MEKTLAVSRLHIWGPAVQIIKSNPLLGVGLDNFKIAFPHYSGIEFNQIDGMFTSSRMAHNELLQMASTTGLLGLSIYLLVVVLFGFQWWKAYLFTGPRGKWILTAVLASAVAYHVQNIFSFGVATINLLWFFHLAVVQAMYCKSINATTNLHVPWLPVNFLKKTAISVLILFILYFPATRLGADIAFSQGYSVSQLMKNPDSGISPSGFMDYSNYEIQQLGKAVVLCPLEVKYQLYLGLAYEERAGIEPSQAESWYLQCLQAYQKAVEMSPANAYYFNDEGRAYNGLGQFDSRYLFEAEKAYHNAVKEDSSSPFFMVNWAVSLEKIGRLQDSQRTMQRALLLDPYFTSKILSQLAFEKYNVGDKKTAFRYLEEAVHGDTSCAETYYCRGILYLSENNKKKALADLVRVKNLHPDPNKNPSIQSLDRFIEQAKN
jgi:tetratricopeptide (TPR) repeat protein